MDNANDNLNTVVQTLQQTVGSIDPSSTTNNSTNVFFSWFKNPLFWVVIIFLLAFLGINIFSYLSKGTQDVTNIFQPLFNTITTLINKLTGTFTGQLVDVTAEGAKDVVSATSTAVGATANAVNAGLSNVQSVAKGQTTSSTTTATATPTPSTATTSNTGVPVQTTAPVQNVQQSSTSQNNVLNTVLNSASPEQPLNDGETQDYQADDATSTIQSGSGKAGWCYIGEDRGFRTCAEVGVNDTCMSGEIFPSQDICINPSLRA